MSYPLIRVQSGKYDRARRLQDEYRRKGISKQLIDCYVEVDLEDRAFDMMRSVKRGVGRFKL